MWPRFAPRLRPVIAPRNSEDAKNITKDRWRQIGPDIPFIATDPEHIIAYQPFNYGMTNIVAICFDQQQLHDRTNSLLDVIYHEIGHCYHYAQGGWTLADYHERPFVRAECEAKAMRFSERWRNMIRFNYAGTDNSLTSNPLLIRASKWLRSI